MKSICKFLGLVIAALTLAAFAVPAAADKVYQQTMSSNPSPLAAGASGQVSMSAEQHQQRRWQCECLIVQAERSERLHGHERLWRGCRRARSEHSCYWRRLHGHDQEQRKLGLGQQHPIAPQAVRRGPHTEQHAGERDLHGGYNRYLGDGRSCGRDRVSRARILSSIRRSIPSPNFNPC